MVLEHPADNGGSTPLRRVTNLDIRSGSRCPDLLFLASERGSKKQETSIDRKNFVADYSAESSSHGGKQHPSASVPRASGLRRAGAE